MKLIIAAFLFISYPIFAQESVYNSWDALDKRIVNAKIKKDDALELLKQYEPELIKYFYENGGKDALRSEWVFPLQNFTKVTHRSEGADYVLSKYDYFQGSESKGHPAHDIFILDDDKNLLDDSTGKPVDVVSMSAGVVAAVDTTWKPGSKLRGGKYVKIFDAANKKLFYYSHLNVVSVKPGDIIHPGMKIGEVGRTGRKTILPEGKTHLHIALLKVEEGYPKPEQIIEDIFRTKFKQ